MSVCKLVSRSAAIARVRVIETELSKLTVQKRELLAGMDLLEKLPAASAVMKAALDAVDRRICPLVDERFELQWQHDLFDRTPPERTPPEPTRAYVSEVSADGRTGVWRASYSRPQPAEAGAESTDA
jgi:hypothetical protein